MSPPANAGEARETSSIPECGKFPGVRNGYPLWYSCLENSMDRGAWWAEVHGGAKELDMTEWLTCSVSHFSHITAIFLDKK